MKKRGFFLWFLLLCLGSLHAQVRQITYKAPDEITWAGVDRAGDLLIVLESGEVQKINKDGKKVGSYKFKTPPTLLDPLDGAQAFYYDRSENVYGTLSSDLSTVNPSLFNAAFAVTPWLICPALHELWILDASDLSLKKTKLRATSIAQEVVIEHAPSKSSADFISLREYQNYIFLLDKSLGIHVFNSLGKYLKTLGEKNISYFSFIGEEIYYLQGNELVLVDLYTDEQRKLTVPLACQFAFMIDDKLYAVQGKQVTIVGFKP